jgi:hypothetical protein
MHLAEKTIFLLCLLSSLTVRAQIVINEFCPQEAGESGGWVEIVNVSRKSQQLKSYSLAIAGDDTSHWCFPDTILAAKQALVIHVTTNNQGQYKGSLCTGFNIEAESNQLELLKNDSLIQNYPRLQIAPGRSIGFIKENHLPIVLYERSSPFLPNYSGLISNAHIESNRRGGYTLGQDSLELTTRLNDLKIRFTTDGTIPQRHNALFEGPMALDESAYSTSTSNSIVNTAAQLNWHASDSARKNIVISAALFDDVGRRRSQVLVRTFEVVAQKSQPLPIISINGEWNDLYSDENGILVPGVTAFQGRGDGNFEQRGRDWEREVNFEFYELGGPGLNVRAGLRVHGGSGRKNQQKGLRLYARKSYGTESFNYPFFGDSIPTKRLVLKPANTTYSHTGIEDFLCSRIANGLNVDVVQVKLAEVFINGIYEGIYSLQERPDKHWLRVRFGAQEPDLISNWNGNVESGSNEEFLSMMAFVEANDLSIDSNFAFVQGLIDIDNFTDYQILEQFIMNRDWPDHNMRCWKDNALDGRWRWIFFDGDAGLIFLDLNSVEHAHGVAANKFCYTGERSSLLLRKLWAHPDYRKRFIQRVEVLLESTFNSNRTNSLLVSLWRQIKPIVQDQINRFHHFDSYKEYEEAANRIQLFLNKQPCRYRNHLNTLLPEEEHLTPCDKGS